MNYLLDTNVISELISKQPDPDVISWIDSLHSENVYLSVITIGEIRNGIEKLPISARKTTLDRWLNNDLLTRFTGRILVLDVTAMLTWGTLIGKLEQSGRVLPALDSLIAALAIHHDCTLATRNEADFLGTGVNIINPWGNSQNK
jgi:toxin FitB